MGVFWVIKCAHSLIKTHLITQNTPILQLFKNSKTSGIIYTYTPTLGKMGHPAQGRGICVDNARCFRIFEKLQNGVVLSN